MIADGALVMVPGLLLDADLFAEQRAALAADGLDVAVADVTQQDTIAAMAEAVLSAQGPGKVAVLGVSRGDTPVRV